jgi:dTDP-D-glucose 4,6-dehydratase
MKQFVTGGAGFIGSNYVRWVLANTDDEVTVYDALTYAGNLSTLRDVDDNPRYQFVKGNICDSDVLEDAMAGHDAVVHLAAESHVDRSIAGPDDFVHTNCFGTNVVVDTARRLEVERVIHIGTDEVYGSVEVGRGARPDRGLVPRQRVVVAPAQGASVSSLRPSAPRSRVLSSTNPGLPLAAQTRPQRPGFVDATRSLRPSLDPPVRLGRSLP